MEEWTEADDDEEDPSALAVVKSITIIDYIILGIRIITLTTNLRTEGNDVEEDPSALVVRSVTL